MSDSSSHFNFPRAPVIEAVIAFHFAQPLQERWADKFFEKRKKDFSIATPHQNIHVDLDTSTTTVTKGGYRLQNVLNGKIIVLNQNVISFSQLAPYQSWEDFTNFAAENFEILEKMAGRLRIEKISTRFINRIDIPYGDKSGSIDLSKYFQVTLGLPSSLKLQVSNFHINYTLADEHNQFLRLVQFAIAEPALIDHQSFLFDIDVISLLPISLRTDEMWKQVHQLREEKNRVFRASITPACEELFK